MFSEHLRYSFCRPCALCPSTKSSGGGGGGHTTGHWAVGVGSSRQTTCLGTASFRSLHSRPECSTRLPNHSGAPVHADYILSRHLKTAEISTEFQISSSLKSKRFATVPGREVLQGRWPPATKSPTPDNTTAARRPFSGADIQTAHGDMHTCSTALSSRDTQHLWEGPSSKRQEVTRVGEDVEERSSCTLSVGT